MANADYIHAVNCVSLSNAAIEKARDFENWLL